MMLVRARRTVATAKRILDTRFGETTGRSAGTIVRRTGGVETTGKVTVRRTARGVGLGRVLQDVADLHEAGIAPQAVVGLRVAEIVLRVVAGLRVAVTVLRVVAGLHEAEIAL
jgi:hypothetical protein